MAMADVRPALPFLLVHDGCGSQRKREKERKGETEIEETDKTKTKLAHL